MITKIFKILDTDTVAYYLVNQLEEVDKQACNRIGIAPGFKIVSRFGGRKVETFAGYRFLPDSGYESIKSQSSGFDLDGTATAFGLLLSEISDISKLPDVVNVEAIRLSYVNTKASLFIPQELLDAIAEHDRDELRKCIFESILINTVIVNIITNEVVYSIKSTGDVERELAEYLWIPVREVSEEEFRRIPVTHFRFKMISPLFEAKVGQT